MASDLPGTLRGNARSATAPRYSAEGRRRGRNRKIPADPGRVGQQQAPKESRKGHEGCSAGLSEGDREHDGRAPQEDPPQRSGLAHARGGRHYKFKQVRGLRKYFKTNAERAIKTIDVEKLIGHAESYYKPSVEYLPGQYERIVPSLTISEADELKDRMQKQAAVSDRKMGEIERENVALQDRLNRLESSYGSFKTILRTSCWRRPRIARKLIRGGRPTAAAFRPRRAGMVDAARAPGMSNAHALRELPLIWNLHTAGMKKESSARKISDDDVARIRERVLELETEIKDFKAALNSYQTKIRRAMVRIEDARELSEE